MKSIFLLLIPIFLAGCKTEKKESIDNAKENRVTVAEEIKPTQQQETIYQFKVEDLSGEEFDFSSLKGKKIMVVNTASECGYTPQYENLQKLYDDYKNENFTIVGFPANNFNGQEPGTNDQIASFCKKNYGVTFPMMSKISVKGDDMHEVYKFLTRKNRNGFEDSEVGWNFQKYLIDESGHVVKVLESKILPDDQLVINWIKE
ncbi:glutathione peroxidase [Abyssalbus ytuae]|uniref:Glutathione peroxidase n=1 Tax=Abyssalbus ytuae TaxID=2926907 RepID=A0A9E6ZMV5_9FLAO|nr:glutathione peroxidase [Abyssalbus ytuae]UOB17255.1 glutathione peroxidase [Abyssalbus ytuae]